MKYELLTTPRFERLFKTLPREIQMRIHNRILELEVNPFIGKKLHGNLKSKFSLKRWKL